MAAILVIDGSASIRATLRIVFGSEHDVTLADAVEAAAPARPPALVILGLPPRPRDDARIGAALARIAPDAPLLVLARPDEVELGALAPRAARIELLPKPFDLQTLRVRVAALLAPAVLGAPPRAADPRLHLEHPFLPHAAARILGQALVTELPLVLIGERGTGAREVARAVHAFGGADGPFVALSAAHLVAEGLIARLPRRTSSASAGGTLFLADLDRAPHAVQHELLAVLRRELPAAVVTPIRVLASTSRDLGTLAAEGRIVDELVYTLGILPLTLTPLRERPADVPPLAQALVPLLAARWRLGAVRLTPAALDRLASYLWFGNVAELEAVLTRTLAVHRAAEIDADDLLFLPESLAAAPRDGPAAARPAPIVPRPTTVAARPAAGPAARAPASAPPAASLEVLLGELAHELRNPMVTIKTFAEHLDSVLADPEARRRFGALTAEAVARMDELLESLLDFARFGPPARRPLALAPLLERVLAEHADELARRHIRIERSGSATGRVEADEGQLHFAARQLLRGLLPDLVSEQPFVVSFTTQGVALRVRTTASVAGRLAAWVAVGPEDAGGETPPLAFALAAVLVHRNGGTLAVRRENDETVITLEWPARGQEG